MKKIILAILILTSTAYSAAFNVTAQWDVQTTGADTNGGAFDPGVASPGTDESTGAGTAITITSGGTTGTASPAFSSTTHGPGNFVHVASGSGCTVGWYEILSQSSGTATFNVTMGSGTCVGVIGGPLLTISTAANQQYNGNTVWIKAGTYTLTSEISKDNVVPGASVMFFRGYGSTHGDEGTKPLITTATNGTDLFRSNTNTNNPTYYFVNLSFSNTAGTRAIGLNVYEQWYAVVVNCVFDGFSNAIYGMAQAVLSGVEIKNSTGIGVYVTATLNMSGSYIHDSITGAQANTPIIRNSILANNSTGGVVSNGLGTSISGCTFYNNGFGIQPTSTTGMILQAENNIFYGQTAWAIDALSTGNLQLRGNAFGSNVSGIVHNSPAYVIPGNITLTANPFTSAGTGNYSLNSVAGGGALLKGTAFPGLFPGGTSTGHLDVGAVQSGAANPAPLTYIF